MLPNTIEPPTSQPTEPRKPSLASSWQATRSTLVGDCDPQAWYSAAKRKAEISVSATHMKMTQVITRQRGRRIALLSGSSMVYPPRRNQRNGRVRPNNTRLRRPVQGASVSVKLADYSASDISPPPVPPPAAPRCFEHTDAVARRLGRRATLGRATQPGLGQG